MYGTITVYASFEPHMAGWLAQTGCAWIRFVWDPTKTTTAATPSCLSDHSEWNLMVAPCADVLGRKRVRPLQERNGEPLVLVKSLVKHI